MNTSERIYGLDLLKCLAMFMIVVLHILGQGGILNEVCFCSAHFKAAWLLEIAAYCAVNCYALISGYNYAHSQFRLHKLALLWLQVIFYTLLITAVFAYFNPDYNTLGTWLLAIFPVTNNQYWYFSAYFGMFFILPILNHTLANISQKYLSFLMAAIFIFVSVLPTFAQTDPYLFNWGYSMLWLSTMYLVGGFIYNCRLAEKVPKWLSFFTYILMILDTWYIQTASVEGGFITRYNSPTMIVAAIALLLFFARLNFRAEFVQNSISILTSLSFSVYLIHTHPLIFSTVISGAFVSFLYLKPAEMAGVVLLTALEIYLLCSLLDTVRLLLFKLLHIENFVRRLFPSENR